MKIRLNKIGFHPLPNDKEVVSFITNEGEVIDSGYFIDMSLYYKKTNNRLFINSLQGCEHDLDDVLFWKSEDMFSEWFNQGCMPIEDSAVQIVTSRMGRHIAIYRNRCFYSVDPKLPQDAYFHEKDIISYRYLKTAEVEHKTCNNATT